MKNKILTGCLIAASAFSFSSCEDFLTEDPKGALTPDNFYNNQKELDLGVNALYAKVQASQCNSNPLIVQVQGDDVTSTTGSNKAAYLSADAFEVPTDAKGLNDAWKRYFHVIKAANLLIDNGGKAATTQEEINIALGQAYYWRAYAYFYLVRIFGPLPLILHNAPDNNSTPLTQVEQIYNQIVNDLKKAEECKLPAKYNKPNRSIDGQNIFISDQTVKATLSAVYMAMAGYPLNKTAMYAEAAAKAKEVIDGVESKKYDQALLPEWKDVYNFGKNHNNETLLGMDYNSTPGGWSDGDSQFASCHQSGKLWGGWGDFLAERRFWKDFPAGPRKNAVYSERILLSNKVAVDWWATNDGEAYNGKNNVVPDFRPMFIGFSLNKDASGKPVAAPFDYNLPVWDGMCINKRHQVIRYAEVLLWYAESAARAGLDLSDAKAALKKVRERAYSDPAQVAAVDAMSANELAEAAYKEHGYEVAGNIMAMVTRRSDQFRMNRLKEAFDYRKGEQKEVLVPAGTLTHSCTADGKAFTYELKADVVVKEDMNITSGWNDIASIYQNYPPKEAEKNPNLKR